MMVLVIHVNLDPPGITFFGDAAYIVDSGNHRILKLTPGSFQGPRRCSAESGGRILRLEPGQEEAAVFFGEET
ncbi:hypothetical protein AK812_SmicGene48254, partial [Symbiodinium microadriaticum]